MAIAEVAGDYKLEVQSLEQNAAAGRYEVKLMELRQATVEDKARRAAELAVEAELAEVVKLNQQVRKLFGEGNYTEAL